MTRPSAGRGFSYNPGIDGLRALAVLAVLLFHLRAGLLPGGYVGVDIFFVISGFVVAGSCLSLDHLRLHQIVLAFYRRRILRIFPALLVVLAVSSLFWILFIPDAWNTTIIRQTLKYAFFGMSNIALGSASDAYFSPTAEYNPFTHTWSLGVEEQFYLLYPAIILIQNRLGGAHGRLLLLIAAASLASLAYCAWLMPHAAQQAFYGMPARFWELGLGVCLCFAMRWWRPIVTRLSARQMSALGLLALIPLIWVLVAPPALGFPFPLALMPVLATGALIMLSYGGGWTSRLFAARGMVAIGQRSYSLYLWHYPVFVLFRWTIGLESLAMMALASVLVIGLAELSYRLVERPFRYGAWIKARGNGAIVALGLVAITLSYAGIMKAAENKHRYALTVVRNVYDWHPNERRPLDPTLSRCALAGSTGKLDGGRLLIFRPVRCSIETPHGRLFAVGDSHILQYNPVLRQIAAAQGRELRIYWGPCEFPQSAYVASGAEACRRYYPAMIAQLRRDLRPGDVLFVSSLRVARFVDQWGFVNQGVDRTGAHRTASEHEAIRAADARIATVVRMLAQTGAQIVFAAPPPMFKAPAFRCADWFTRGGPICAQGLVMSRAEVESWRAPILRSIAIWSGDVPSAHLWDPLPYLCDAGTCSTMRDGRPLFYDGDHLSGHASDVLFAPMSDMFSGLFDAQTANHTR